MTRGIYVTPTEFVSFAESRQRNSLSEQIATRDRSTEFSFGFILPNPDPILKRQGKDIGVYRDMRSRAHIGGCIRRRKAAVKALEWKVERGKASARSTRLANDLLASYDIHQLLNEITDAVLFGYQPLELMWAPFNGALAPRQVIGKPQEWFFFDQEAQLRFRSREQPMRGEELPARKFLLARQEASYANPYGFADLSMCFWADTFMRGGLKFWVSYVEKYGSPWLVGKTPRNTPGPQNEELLDKLESMIQDAIAVIPDDSSIDIVEAEGKGVNSDLYEQLLMYCRSEIAIALLGQNQSTEANSNRASATAGLEVAKTIRDGDARLAAATINQLLRWVTDLNESEQAPAPTFELYEEEDVNTAQAERDKTLAEAGLTFTAEYWKRTYSLEDGDIALAPATPAAPVDTVTFAAPVPIEFAETPQASSTDAAVRTLSESSASIMAGWIRQLRAVVNAHTDKQELQDALLEAYGDLSTDELTELMALAFELAHLKGRDQAEQEAGRG